MNLICTHNSPLDLSTTGISKILFWYAYINIVLWLRDVGYTHMLGPPIRRRRWSHLSDLKFNFLPVTVAFACVGAAQTTPFISMIIMKLIWNTQHTAFPVDSAENFHSGHVGKLSMRGAPHNWLPMRYRQAGRQAHSKTLIEYSFLHFQVTVRSEKGSH